jgi:hypothetical protein
MEAGRVARREGDTAIWAGSGTGMMGMIMGVVALDAGCSDMQPQADSSLVGPMEPAPEPEPKPEPGPADPWTHRRID